MFGSGDFYLLMGVFLFFAGTLLGIPYGLSKGKGDANRTELWRVAHLSTCIGGVTLIALTLALERLLGNAAIYTLAPFSVAAYVFFFACTLGGWFNKAWWDEDKTQMRVVLIYRLQIIASALSVIAIVISVATLCWKMVW